MTRSDWGEELTYTGPLDAEYYASGRYAIELDELIEMNLRLLDLGAGVNDSELMNYYVAGLKPMAGVLRIKGREQEATELEEIIEKFRLAS